MLEAFHELKHAEGFTPSNYRVRTNDETCIGCGLCVKRCPMEAIQLQDAPAAKNRITTVVGKKGNKKELKNRSGKVSAVNTDLCIGCGVCAYKCPTKSLVLEHRETIEAPPKDAREYAKLVMADFAAGRAKREQEAES